MDQVLDFFIKQTLRVYVCHITHIRAYICLSVRFLSHLDTFFICIRQCRYYPDLVL